MNPLARFLVRLGSVAAAAAALMAVGSAHTVVATLVPAREKYLLLDSRVIDRTENAVLRVGTVQKHPGNPLIRDDQPWEQNAGNMYPNVVFDAGEQVYKMWYETLNSPIMEGQIPWMRAITLGALGPDPYGPLVERKGRGTSWRIIHESVPLGNCTLLYATSKDGLHWTKPPLDVYRYENRPTNIVMLRTHGTGVFKDDHDPDPARRYKLINSGPAPGGRPHVAVSADGIVWSDLIDTKVTAASDTHNNIMWDPDAKIYVGIIRGWSTGALGWNLPEPLPWKTMAGGTGAVRTVVRIESKDFLTWSQPVEIMRGPPNAQTHDMHAFRTAGIYLGLTGILGVGQDLRREQVELSWSPDGRTWSRIEEGAPIIPLGEKQGDYDWGCIFAASSPVILKDEIRLYYCGSPQTLNLNEKFQCLATLRPDGWAGYTPKDAAQPGLVVTQPLVAMGGALRVTADVEPGGYVKVKVLGLKDQTLAESARLEKTVTEGVALEIAGFEPQAVRVQFELSKAKVYAFGFGGAAAGTP